MEDRPYHPPDSTTSIEIKTDTQASPAGEETLRLIPVHSPALPADSIIYNVEGRPGIVFAYFKRLTTEQEPWHIFETAPDHGNVVVASGATPKAAYDLALESTTRFVAKSVRDVMVSHRVLSALTSSEDELHRQVEFGSKAVTAVSQVVMSAAMQAVARRMDTVARKASSPDDQEDDRD
jgi:hypothetical protein